jgi:hypothetical protein
MVRYTAVDLGSTCPKNVARCMSRQLGSMPCRYQRSRVATAKECRVPDYADSREVVLLSSRSAARFRTLLTM